MDWGDTGFRKGTILSGNYYSLHDGIDEIDR